MQQISKSALTRQKLVDAAISCIAKYGYAGTDMNIVSNAAGLSRGPRQYYFPQKVDLMLAVWDEIILRARRRIDNLDLISKSLEQRIELLIVEEIERISMDEYLADLELRLAARGDAQLDAALSPLIKSLEKKADEWWLSLFQEAVCSIEMLLSSRYFAVLMLRGLAIEKLSSRDPRGILIMEQDLLQTMRQKILIDDN